MMMKCLWLLAAVIFLGASKKLPSDFKICDHFGPNLNGCLHDAVLSAIRQLKNGLPEIDAPSIDPAVISNATIEKGDFILNFNNIRVYNISDSAIQKISAMASSSAFHVDVLVNVEEVLVATNFLLKGKLFLFSLDGGGPATIRFKNLSIDMSFDSAVVETRGVPHYKIKDCSVKLKTQSMVFNMRDIFPGRSELDDLFNKALNANWDVFFGETRPDFEEILKQFFVKYIDNVFKYVPVQFT